MLRITLCCTLLLGTAACGTLDGSDRPAGGDAEYLAEAEPASFASARRIWAGEIWSFGITPDGRQAITEDDETGDVKILDFGTGDSRRLTNNHAPYEPGYGFAAKVAPDGNNVVYTWWDVSRSSTYELEVMNLATKERRTIEGSVSAYIHPADWSPDQQTILAYRRIDDGTSQIVLVPVAGGEVRVIRSLQWHEPLQMNFSPDARFIVFDVPQEPIEVGRRDLAILDLLTGAESRLGEDGSDEFLLGWYPSGERILFGSDRGGTPGAWSMEVKGGRPSGAPTLIRPDMWKALPVGFTPDGSYYYSAEMGGMTIQIDRIDPATGLLSGRPTVIADAGLPSALRSAPIWSPDGRAVAFRYQDNYSAGAAVWLHIYTVETGEIRKLRIPPPLRYQLVHHRWTPDGRALLFAAYERSRSGVYRLDVQTGQVDPLFRLGHEERVRTLEVTRDGRSIVYTRIDPTGNAEPQLLAYDIVTGDHRAIGGQRPVRGGIASPDGQWRAGGGSNLLRILPFEGGGEVIRELARPHLNAMEWSADSRKLLFTAEPGIIGSDRSGAEIEFCPGCTPKELWWFPVDGGDPIPVGVLSQPAMAVTVSMNPQETAVVFVSGTPAWEVWSMEIPRAGQ